MKRLDVYTLFCEQRCAARKRGIEFNLTFEQWTDIWKKSDRWAKRACRVNQYVMSRPGDTGPYAVGNVQIMTSSRNHEDAWRGKSHRPATIRRMRIAQADPLPISDLTRARMSRAQSDRQARARAGN